LSISAALAKHVRMVILDVDGVMTDGGIYIGVSTEGHLIESKRFEITDGLGVVLLTWAGLIVYMVSGRSSTASAHRAEELEIKYREAKKGFKLPVVEKIRREHDLEWDQICCIGDDLADLPILNACGLPVAVANAVPEVRAAATWHTQRKGGDGAVRELAEALLRARGEYDALVQRYVHERS
jgi:3-deoxy-D-manno-octulosonate 8-phosphate phosphatase (KDO 8-P phosphatase)